MSSEISGKNVLITGGARGIGRALSRHFLSTRNQVYILDLDEAELANTANVHLKQYSKHLAYSVCNLRSVDSVRSNVAKAAEFFGGNIDVLINNGGIASPHWKDGKTMEDLETVDEWHAYIETNLTVRLLTYCLTYLVSPYTIC